MFELVQFAWLRIQSTFYSLHSTFYSLAIGVRLGDSKSGSSFCIISLSSTPWNQLEEKQIEVDVNLEFSSHRRFCQRNAALLAILTRHDPDLRGSRNEELFRPANRRRNKQLHNCEQLVKLGTEFSVRKWEANWWKVFFFSFVIYQKLALSLTRLLILDWPALNGSCF